MGKKIEPNKVKAIYGVERVRLGAEKEKDHWFRYDRKNLFGNIYEKVAKKVLKLYKTDGEDYFSSIKIN